VDQVVLVVVLVGKHKLEAQVIHLLFLLLKVMMVVKVVVVLLIKVDQVVALLEQEQTYQTQLVIKDYLVE
tara:strand:- start:315 stop:524 length:210 start_codon:yes stop_codon:yes gene_type:complete